MLKNRYMTEKGENDVQPAKNEEGKVAMEMTISHVSNFEISPGPHAKIRLSHPKAMQGGCSYFTDRLTFI